MPQMTCCECGVQYTAAQVRYKTPRCRPCAKERTKRMVNSPASVKQRRKVQNAANAAEKAANTEKYQKRLAYNREYNRALHKRKMEWKNAKRPDYSALVFELP